MHASAFSVDRKLADERLQQLQEGLRARHIGRETMMRLRARRPDRLFIRAAWSWGISPRNEDVHVQWEQRTEIWRSGYISSSSSSSFTFEGGSPIYLQHEETVPTSETRL